VTRLVPVEQMTPGQVVVLPRGRRVKVERVDLFDGLFVVRWTRPDSDHPNGVQLGSLRPARAGETWEVAS
jgi:hypothetical protein